MVGGGGNTAWWWPALLGGRWGREKGGGNENLGREMLCYRFEFFFKLVNPGWVNQRNRGLWMQSTATILKFENLRFQNI
jgi:hypothetical protein